MTTRPHAIPYFHVDAFASRVFAGNPAGVCLLDGWLPEADMQAIAAENRHSETAFLVPASAVGPVGAAYQLRWFTPVCEIDLCGHATLAAAYVVFDFVADPDLYTVSFASASGELRVLKLPDGLLELDFPTRPARGCPAPPGLARALGAEPREVLEVIDQPSLLAVLGSEAEVAGLHPDFAALATLDRKVIVTARGERSDFVSRFFAPAVGVPEDPVTGSAHCTLTPFWAERLGKTRLDARQVSARGGELRCELRGDRVGIAGRALLYLRGTIYV